MSQVPLVLGTRISNITPDERRIALEALAMAAGNVDEAADLCKKDLPCHDNADIRRELIKQVARG